ncbi:type II toxin-antitoxin system Phd/YefM family antitoxin [Candidatus Chloroploca sp. M-50]|uniref:Antitoxin n=1 Tax=Candidatus Chloroploca mongolica TaxID=2528176 RepID=A0ABS4DEZ4_9CHLR|nr:type II toxin-antitoxin system Phd/YefM family antitoxin [Candidatus Chloroploca mongolica]MBP1467996.1 type II toxin-antitoxin system Phd/YefM family antitoxin [Candidatus Chloroploca mongolica]
MPASTRHMFDIDLQHGVLPVSQAASSLAAMIRRSAQQQRPVVITQKGKPTAVLLSVELFAVLRALVDDARPPAAAPPEG